MTLKFSTMAALAAICFSGAGVSGCASLDALEQQSIDQVASLDDTVLCRQYLSMYDNVPTRYGDAVERELLKRRLDDAACHEHAPSPLAGAVVAGALTAAAVKHPGRVSIDDDGETHWSWRHETSPLRGPRWTCRGELHHDTAPDARCGPKPNEVAVQQ